MEDVDLILLICDGSLSPQPEDQIFGEGFQSLKKKPPVFIVLNKIDKLPSSDLDRRIAEFETLLPGAPVIPVSALTGDNLDLLLNKILDLMPEGPFYYPEDQVTDLYERDIAADLIRATAMDMLSKELPHVIAVRIDEYKIRDDESAYIEATIFGERDSQKGILIGQKGRMIKRIGSAARKAIESMSGRKVFLQLRVKIRKNWRNDPNALRLFGFKRKVS
jgi:GTP-binding protein Era